MVLDRRGPEVPQVAERPNGATEPVALLCGPADEHVTIQPVDDPVEVIEQGGEVDPRAARRGRR